MDSALVREVEDCIGYLEEIKSSLPHGKGGLKFPEISLRKLYLIQAKLRGIGNVLEDFRKHRGIK